MEMMSFAGGLKVMNVLVSAMLSQMLYSIRSIEQGHQNLTYSFSL